MHEFLKTETLNVPRVHYSELSQQDFLEKYQIPNQPVIIEGLADDWPAFEKWDFKTLYKEYGDVEFEIGEEQDGTPVKMALKDYIQYMIFNRDDSPAYLFQRNLHKDERMKELLKDYKVPVYFENDYQRLMDDKHIPDYNWFLIGPRRSGSYIHYDPFSMSAWNTSLCGHKKWFLIDPNLDRDTAEANNLRDPTNIDNYDALYYVINFYPKVVLDSMKKYEFIQKKGDTIFLPSRWWHVVINIDDTIAITQNFTNKGNFERVWKHFRKSRKNSACNWLRNMKLNNPELFQQAKAWNEEDGFKMYDEYKASKILI